MALTASYNWIDKYIVHARLRQPLHVGSPDKGTGEVLVHPVEDKPFVQASGIAGVFRSCYEGLFKDGNQALDLFGDSDKTAGRIRFTDGEFLGDSQKMKIELRPRIRINPETGTSAASKGKGLDSASGQKFETEYIGAGSEIEFRVYVYSNITAEGTPEQKRILQVFALIHSGQVQFGGQKSNGCGSMEILSLRHHAFDMLDRQGRRDWANEENLVPAAYNDLRGELEALLEENRYSLRAYTLTLEAETEGALLVKSIALTDEEIKKFADRKEKEPDYVNMRNVQGYYIIPGSSIKGAVRAQFERIAGYMEKNTPGFKSGSLVGDAFGKTGKKKDTGASGNVRFYDVLVGQIEGHEKNLIYNRIRIDRFTGGVMNTGLFKEQAVHGKLSIEAAVMKDTVHGDTVKEDRSCAMLILALRDLALGIYNLGSGYSVGRGFLRADKLVVQRADNATAEIIFSRETGGGASSPAAAVDGRIRMTVNDPEGILGKCLQALAEAPEKESADEAGKEGA